MCIYGRLQLLNTTVASLALATNNVLTATYNAIYGSERGNTELVLLTAPLSSNLEIQALYDSQLIDWRSALPVALHSLGASSSDIAEAVARRQKQEDEKKQHEDEDRTQQQRAAALDLKKTEVEIKQTAATTPKAAPKSSSPASSSKD